MRHNPAQIVTILLSQHITACNDYSGSKNNQDKHYTKEKHT